MSAAVEAVATLVAEAHSKGRERFPRFRRETVVAAIAARSGITQSRAALVLTDCIEQGALVRTGASSATRYTTAEVHDADIASRVEAGRVLDATVSRLVALGVYDQTPYLGLGAMTDSKGVRHTYHVAGHYGVSWDVVRRLLELVPRDQEAHP